MTKDTTIQTVPAKPAASRRVLSSFMLLLVSLVWAQPPEGADHQEPPPDDLAKRLIRESVDGAQGDLMDRLLRLMDDAAYRLEIEFDAGPRTRALQAEIAEALDQAIRAAAARQQPASSTQPTARGDRRTGPEGPPDRSADKEAQEPGAPSGSETTEGDRAGDAASLSGAADRLREAREAWGHLPQRARDEMFQGIQEDYLERYRDWIERYYRALQDADE